MKKLGLIALFVFTVSVVAAQDQELRAFKKGNSIVSVGYGFINYWKILVKENITVNKDESTLKATGPFILGYEYALLKRISLGVSLGYSEVEVTIPFGSYDQVTTLKNFSAILLANYHFLNSKRFDPYVGGGIGYYMFEAKNKDDLGVIKLTDPNQFAVSCQFGCRYYFSKRFGVYAEGGYVGGALAQVGLMTKF